MNEHFDQIKVLVTGDFCPINRIEMLVEKNDYASIFNDFLPILQESDLNITNLECPLYEGNTPINKSGPNLKGTIAAANALKFGKFDLVTLANNHIMDHGEQGLRSTIGALVQNEISYVGAGMDTFDAERVFYYTHHDITVAVINICENEFGMAGISLAGANGIDVVRNYYHVTEAKKNADFVILIMHGGHEYYELPSPRVQKLCRFFIDLGVDVVINHHTHCPSGFEKYKEGNIFYGLGNFVFDWDKLKKDSWYYGYAVNLTMSKKNRISFKIVPYTQNRGSSTGLQVLKEREPFIKEIERLNETIIDAHKLEERWIRLSEGSYKHYISSLMPIDNKYLKAALHKLGLNFPFSKKAALKISNLVRCESHRDLFLAALYKYVK